MLLVAARDVRTLTAIESAHLHSHVDGCTECSVVAADPERGWRWISRLPAQELAVDENGEELPILGLPSVDPIVFRIEGEIGAGGMGRIARAFDRRLGREVALKENLAVDMRDRFEREVRITARLQHPAIVPIYEAGEFPDGTAFYAMRFVAGRTFAQAINDAGTFANRLALLPHMRALTDALAYAHSNGVIHRDLKPTNVLVGEFGETVVIDWGIAKDVAEPELPLAATIVQIAPDAPAPRVSASKIPTRDLTHVGTVIGTPGFMSPAQANGETAGPADDVFALGAILYTLLAGTTPYSDTAGHHAEALLAQTIVGPPTPIEALAPRVPQDLRAIVERAMHRDPAARFPTAKELSEDLARYETGQLLRSRTYTRRELVLRWLQRHWRGVALAVLVVAALGVALGLGIRYRQAASELAIRARAERATDFYGDVARQAYYIDRDMLHLESGLEGLAAAAAGALTNPPPSTMPLLTDDFADAAHLPTDFNDPTTYRWRVSVNEPVTALAPGVDRAAVLPDLMRLGALRGYIHDMVLEAAVGDITTVSAAAATKLLRTRKSPIDYAYVDLPSGVHYVWPGNANLRPGYDARTASFYTMSKNQHGVRWGAPYVDSSTDSRGDDLVLPCTRGIWSAAGEFLGVAGVEITVTKLVETRMKLAGRTIIRASLVDGKGHKVVDDRDANTLFHANGRDEAVAFTMYDLPDIVAAINTGDESVRTTTRDGHPIMVAFVRLESIGWYYVVEVDADRLGLR
jgi:serine/threonine protein kinase